MRVFVSADMEGVAGIARDEQTDPSSALHPAGRHLLTQEVNAAVEGALQAGVQEIVVSDGHWTCVNLDPEELHPRAELVSGYPRRRYMGAGMGPGFDAAFFVGYHAAVGTPDAVLDHSYADPRVVRQVRLNGTPQSEGSLTGYLCGTFDCPVALFTGDAAAVSQMHEFVLEVEGVVVKEGLGRQAARSLHPHVARERIRAGAKRAIERLDNIPPMRLEGTVELEVDLTTTAMADSCERVPCVRRLGPRTVGYATAEYVEMYDLFLALVDLAMAAV
ncbi:MAG: peptidase M55 [Chloroflexi bacterium]|nr:MAG: peptidase M55 [Chloroflexota bacterium]